MLRLFRRATAVLSRVGWYVRVVAAGVIVIFEILSNRLPKDPRK